MSDDLIAFLRARYDDDEQVARQAIAWQDDRMTTHEYAWSLVSRLKGQVKRQDIVQGAPSPTRVLAEVEAKRRILDLHIEAGRLSGDGYPIGGYAWCSTCGSGEPNEYPTEWPCATVRLLALPYAHHPDYREEWRPAAD